MVRFDISKNEVAKLLNLDLPREDINYIRVSTIDNPENNTVLFLKKIAETHIEFLRQLKG
ncbi:MAG: hypothetical protein ACVCEJ_07130 [Candidatus Izemoplasmataceae bacterium]